MTSPTSSSDGSVLVHPSSCLAMNAEEWAEQNGFLYIRYDMFRFRDAKHFDESDQFNSQLKSFAYDIHPLELYLYGLVEDQDPDTIVCGIQDKHHEEYYGFTVYTKDYDIWVELSEMRDLWIESVVKLLNGEYSHLHDDNGQVLVFPSRDVFPS